MEDDYVNGSQCMRSVDQICFLNIFVALHWQTPDRREKAVDRPLQSCVITIAADDYGNRELSEIDVPKSKIQFFV